MKAEDILTKPLFLKNDNDQKYRTDPKQKQTFEMTPRGEKQISGGFTNKGFADAWFYGNEITQSEYQTQ